MIDELDLAFDDHVDKTRPRHRRRRGGGKGGKSGVAFLMAFILLAVLGGGVYFGYNKVKGFFTAADYDGEGTTAVQVTVQKGDLLSDIGNKLVDATVIKSTKAFTEAADKEPRSKNIQAGTYNMRKQMSAKNALALMLDPKSHASKGITIPEGKTMMDTFKILSDATKIPIKDFQDAAKNPEDLGVQSWWFNKRSDGKKVQVSVEGFLFPDTYEFDAKATAKDILSKMVDRFNTVVGDLDFANAVQSNLHITPFEALTVASMSQVEAGVPEDLPKVARVAYNRAYVKKPAWVLQFDSTTNYWLRLQGKDPKDSGDLLQKELDDTKNPYNTNKVTGLPVGPIDSPGKAALEGAAQPAKGTYVFFVAIDKAGHSAFADTNEQQEHNKQIACQNGVNIAGCK